MMTITQHLLMKVAEECAEVAQRASKAAIFGIEERQPTLELAPPNSERFMLEYVQLQVTVEILQQRGELPVFTDEKKEILRQERLKRLRKYLLYSQEQGLTEKGPLL